MNILFLYYHIHIITSPSDPEAPYVFPEEEGVTFYSRKDFNAEDIISLYKNLSPKFVYISGWGDKTYMKAAIRLRKGKTPIICSCDNQWRGDARQILASIFKRRYLQNRFSHIFIAGMYQYPLALHLGFAKRQILLGMNTADLSLFHDAYNENADPTNYPHNFLYVGRFVEIKGLQELVDGFIELSKEINHDWTLTLVGAGPLKSNLPKNSNIIYKDFLQPKELPSLVKTTGCFVLPSRVEPWGVVLHEFAGAGLPLIATNICGAATAFIRAGYNGFLHEPNSKEAVKQSLLKIIKTDNEGLIEMGKRSHRLSYHITKESWASTLLSAEVTD